MRKMRKLARYSCEAVRTKGGLEVKNLMQCTILKNNRKVKVFLGVWVFQWSVLLHDLHVTCSPSFIYIFISQVLVNKLLLNVTQKETGDSVADSVWQFSSFTVSEQMCQGVSGPRGSNLSNIYSALNHTTGGVQNLCTEILGGQAKHNEGQCHTNTEKRQSGLQFNDPAKTGFNLSLIVVLSARWSGTGGASQVRTIKGGMRDEPKDPGQNTRHREQRNRTPDTENVSVGPESFCFYILKL